MLREESFIVRQKKEDKDSDKNPESLHQEAIEFAEKHRDLFEQYARGRIKIAPAPKGLDTFAFDLKTNTIYLNARFFRQLGFSEEKTAFATLHEIEHFLEKIQLLSEEGGVETFERYLERIGKSKAFGVMDNCVADVRENRTVVARTHQGFGEVEQKCYREDLFPSTDFTNEPMHLQMAYALLREARIPDEKCQVAPEVRTRIDKLKSIASADGKVRLWDILTHPDTPMSKRMQLQDKFVWPLVQELLQEDLKKEQEKKESGESGEGQGSEGESGEEGADAKEGKKDSKDQSGKGKEQKGMGEKKKGESGKSNDPNEVFSEAYGRAAKKFPEAVSAEAQKKALEDWKKENDKSAGERADEEYAKKIGVKEKELKDYRQIVESLEKITDPETGENAIAELSRIISRIIAKRKKPMSAPKYPVEEGDDIVDPATLVAEVKAGNLNPKVWETIEIKEKPGQKFGEVEITLVCDRSGSMNGQKLVEQRRAAVLFLETLKDFADQAEEERSNSEKPLEIRSEIFTFQNSERDAKPVKEMSAELGEKERIDAATLLSSASGSTTDFVSLEAILKSIGEETEKKIAEGELKKIVIVFTDGESDSPETVRSVLKSLRDKKVVVIGVGITSDGKAALETYAPEARLAETAEKLPSVLADLLKEHLANV